VQVLVAPDSFKGTFSAARVAAHVAAGIRGAGGGAVELPVADGGEGTYEILCAALGAETVLVETVGPWRDPLTAAFGLAGRTAVIGLASASGLTLPAPGPRDPLAADTYGTGILLAEAVRRGAEQLVVAAGGSATTDGGTGAVAAIEDRGGLGAARITVLSDVTTVFEDAAVVFGPQKGADPGQVDELTARLHLQAAAFPRDPRGVLRTGAAGGFSGGLWAHYGAELVSGADFILDAVGFDRHAAEADAIIVGEGRLDSQTGQGKIISAILGRNPGRPVYAVVGSVGAELGSYARNFAGIIVAGDEPGFQAAGAEVAARLSPAGKTGPAGPALLR